MPLSTLCQRCGLCCDGSLFTHVALHGAEVEVARAHGLDVVERADGSPALRQCCTALEGRRCAVYADRPEGCRRYRCMLLGALAEGEVSLGEALSVVEQAQALISGVERALPPEDGAGPRAVMQRARRAELVENGGPLPSEARTALDLAQDFLARHFLGRRT